MTYEVESLILKSGNENVIVFSFDDEHKCVVEFTDYIKVSLSELTDILKEAEYFNQRYHEPVEK